ncbi:hypothetical protein RM543_00760 [Roseicyclus sp. F158]|uniref:SGNH/GDSL hydrolase family protein n=1 Tax=Tropicimonas omnivorans TaxID=3075590 RepID=A0ABU3DBW0_9RHOB|nr:hypothetical protein [Roseicyclus sp. F158]MDT0681197.1 hypothetical protein [Roseicyclus sp. F158]
MQIVAFGHSHLSALSRAWKEAPIDGVDVSFHRLNGSAFQPNFEDDRQDRRLSGAAADKIAKIIGTAEPDLCICAAMGNEYNALAMLEHPRPFDVDWPESGLPAREDAELIPVDLMRATIKRRAERGALLFWDAIAAAAPGRAVLVAPPPPVADEAHIRANRGAFGERIDRYGIAPAATRLKIWALYSDILADAAERKGGLIVHPPAECLDDGYLGAGYRADDPTHANPAYGLKLLTDILDRTARDRRAA